MCLKESNTVLGHVRGSGVNSKRLSKYEICVNMLTRRSAIAFEDEEQHDVQQLFTMETRLLKTLPYTQASNKYPNDN